MIKKKSSNLSMMPMLKNLTVVAPNRRYLKYAVDTVDGWLN